MKFLSVFWCLFLSVQTFGEIPFEQLRGLHTSMTDDAKAFSPLYGFAALKGNVLKNIRFYGNYGKENYGLMDNGSGALVPKPGFNPGFMHPTFLPKRPGSPGGDAVDAAGQERRNAENLFEVPLDPISALMQWLFPSVDGVNFVANDRSNDPVGYFALTRIERAQKQEELEKIERQIIAVKARDDYAAYDSLSGRDRGTHEIGLTLKPLSKQKGDLQTTLKAPVKSFAGILRVIHQFVDKGPVDHDSFVGAMMKVLPNVATRPGEVSKSQIFAEILYSALIEDGTFSGGNWDWMMGRSAPSPMATASGDGSWMSLSRSDDGLGPLTHNPLYPKNIALHALLGYFWSICDNKSELVEAYDAIGFINPEQKERALREFYTEANYGSIKAFILKNVFAGMLSPEQEEDFTFAGYGYEAYEQSLPSELGYTQANVPSFYGQIKHSYPDCGETALRNFFNILTYARGGIFDKKLLNLPSPKMDQIRKFYERFPTQSDQLSQYARDAWSNIIINLNDNPHSDPSSNFGDINDVYYRGKHTRGIFPDGFRFSEIASTPHGIINVLNVFARLTNDAALSESWVAFDVTRLNESPELFEQITRKLDRLCSIFLREGFALDWNLNGNKNLKGLLHGEFKFSINESDAFAFSILEGHFIVSPLQKNSKNWRVDVLSDYINQPFTGPFYGPLKSKQPFWTGQVTQQNIFDLITDWKKKFKGRPLDHPSVLTSLRTLKKFYWNVLDDDAGAERLLGGLTAIFGSMQQQEGFFSEEKLPEVFRDYILEVWKKNPRQIIFSSQKTILSKTWFDLVMKEISNMPPDKRGAFLNEEDSAGNSPLVYALTSREEKFFENLISLGADFSLDKIFRDGSTYLGKAIEMESPHMVSSIIEKGVNVNEACILEKTPLEYAVEKMDLTTLYTGTPPWFTIFQFLIKAGADPRIAFSDGSTVFHKLIQRIKDSAAIQSSGRIGEYVGFIARLFDVNQKDKFGGTPLERMLRIEGSESLQLYQYIIASVLLDSGADPTITFSDGDNIVNKLFKDIQKKMTESEFKSWRRFKNYGNEIIQKVLSMGISIYTKNIVSYLTVSGELDKPRVRKIIRDNLDGQYDLFRFEDEQDRAAFERWLSENPGHGLRDVASEPAASAYDGKEAE